MALSTEARTAGVLAALLELRGGRDPRIPRPGDPTGPERGKHLAEVEADLLSLAWQVTVARSEQEQAPAEVTFAEVVAMSQHWIDTNLCPTLAVDLSAGHRLCDSPLYRALRAALVMLETMKPDDAHDIRSRLLGTASAAARQEQTAPTAGADR